MRLWIARDEDKFLGLYRTQPILNKERDRYNEEWDGDYISSLAKSFFPEVTFENSPQEIELKLVNNTTNGFAEDLLTNCKPLEGEFSKFVDDNFDNLI